MNKPFAIRLSKLILFLFIVAMTYGRDSLAIDPSLWDAIKKSQFIDSILIPIIPPTVEYPLKGREAQLRCVVWTRATVGVQGSVKEAVAVNCDQPGYGFEEAAIKSILATIFEPKWDGPNPIKYSGYYPVFYSNPHKQYGRIPTAPKDLTGFGIDAPIMTRVSGPQPVYPAKAVSNLVEGDVYLKILIDPKGKVRNVDVFRSTVKDFGFESAAQSAIKASVFPSKKENGREVKYSAYAKVSFTLSDEHLRSAGLPLPVDSISPDEEAVVTFQMEEIIPAQAIYRGWGGTVWIITLIDDAGKVVTARVDSSCGHPILDSTALTSAQKKQYRPAIKVGRPIAYWRRYETYFPNSRSVETEDSRRPEVTMNAPTKGSTSYEFGDVDHPEIQAKFKKFEKSIYPAELEQEGITGRVKLAALVDTNGAVIEILIPRSGGNELFDSAASKAVPSHVFEPGLINGKPVKSWTSWIVDFSPNSRTVVSQLKGDDIKLPVFTKLIQAHYPEKEFRMGIEGRVWLSVHVDTLGDVTSAEVYSSSGVPALDSSAVKSAYSQKFQPALKNGYPVAFWTKYKIEFIISNNLD